MVFMKRTRTSSIDNTPSVVKPKQVALVGVRKTPKSPPATADKPVAVVQLPMPYKATRYGPVLISEPPSHRGPAPRDTPADLTRSLASNSDEGLDDSWDEFTAAFSDASSSGDLFADEDDDFAPCEGEF